MIHMPNEHVVAALDALRSEYTGALDQARRLRKELDEATAQVTKLETAIKSLELLLGSPSESHATPCATDIDEEQRAAPTAHVPTTVTILPGAGAPRDEDEEVPQRLAPYVPSGGQRLKSKLMVFDLLRMIGKPMTRDKLRREFFDYYGRENLEKYWQRPDNALHTAIDRAIDEKLILEVTGENGRQAMYTIGFEGRRTGRPATYAREDD